MGKYAQFVMGPAGCGKSTYCLKMAEYCESIKRRVHIVNLDPAAEDLNYEPSIDIRKLIKADEVAQKMAYGPNGALFYAMQYFIDNVEWFMDELGDYDDDYLIIDCPGQLELYSHVSIMRTLVDLLQRQANYRLVGLYLIDSQFLAEPSKFISGVLSCLTAMVKLELPHINVLSKMDLLKQALPLAKAPKPGHLGLSHGFFDAELEDFKDYSGDLGNESNSNSDSDDDDDSGCYIKEREVDGDGDDDGYGCGFCGEREEVLEHYTTVDVPYLLGELDRETGPKFRRLNEAIGQLLEDYNMVSLAPLDITKDESLDALLMECDSATQYGEDEEPEEPADDGDRDDDGDGDGDSGMDTFNEPCDNLFGSDSFGDEHCSLDDND